VDFPVSYDRTTKIVSAIVSAFLLVVALAVQQAMVAAVSLVMVALAYAFSPRGYTVSEGAIVVRRLIGDVRFPLERVREARRADAGDLAGTIRLWGNGGMFGYYGLFRTSRLGRCWWYLTNRRNTVVVITEAKTALFSPDDVEGFLAAVRASAPTLVWPAGGPRRRSPATWIGMGVVAVAVAAVAFGFLYAPGPPAYTLTPGALEIHDRFYPVTIGAAGVDVARIRIVDIATDTAWRPTARTNGFANSHYRSGWFRVANGQKVRLYRASGTRLVLLPPRGAGEPVLLEVDDPEMFVEDVRRTWAHSQPAASHGVLDALRAAGGGVAFFAPRRDGGAFVRPAEGRG
jgi:hypothetical protein